MTSNINHKSWTFQEKKSVSSSHLTPHNQLFLTFDTLYNNFTASSYITQSSNLTMLENHCDPEGTAAR